MTAFEKSVLAPGIKWDPATTDHSNYKGQGIATEHDWQVMVHKAAIALHAWHGDGFHMLQMLLLPIDKDPQWLCNRIEAVMVVSLWESNLNSAPGSCYLTTGMCIPSIIAHIW